MGTVSHRFKQSADAVYAALTDPDHLERRAAAAGHRNIEVRAEDVPDGKKIHMERDIEADIPAFARKVVNPVNHVVTDFEWKKSGDGYRATYVADVNPRIRIKSSVTLKPAGDGCEYIDDYAAEVDVPLIGKKIAGAVEKETQSAVAKDLKWTEEDLG